jgi:hypothetical protein
MIFLWTVLMVLIWIAPSDEGGTPSQHASVWPGRDDRL